MKVRELNACQPNSLTVVALDHNLLVHFCLLQKQLRTKRAPLMGVLDLGGTSWGHTSSRPMLVNVVVALR